MDLAYYHEYHHNNPRIHTPDLRTRPIQNVAQLQPLSGLGEAQEQSTDVVQRMLNGVPTGEQFVMDNIIGKGTFGEVYACQLPNGSLVAVKKVHKSKVLTIQTISCISHEFRMLREPDLTRRHQNIMYIDDVLQSRSHLYIVMALGGKVSNGGGTGEGMHADGQGPYGRVRSCKQTRGTPSGLSRCHRHLNPGDSKLLPYRMPTGSSQSAEVRT